MKSSGKADWWQLHIACHQTHHATVDEWLAQLDAAAITLLDGKNEPIYLTEPDSETLWQTLHIRALLSAPLLAKHTEQLQKHQQQQLIVSWHLEPLPEQDWQQQCQAQHHAIKHGARLWTYPHWDPPPGGDNNAIHVHIDPGLAFGTGSHPTTALCLAWLDQHIHQQQTMIDYGCGSGILGIAAVRLGVGMVHAIDHDPQALSATQQNANNNQVSDRLQTHHCTPTPHIEADIVMANILANPLIELTHTLASHTKSGGVCVISGILKDQINSLEHHYKQYFEPREVYTQDDWACLVLHKP